MNFRRRAVPSRRCGARTVIPFYTECLYETHNVELPRADSRRDRTAHNVPATRRHGRPSVWSSATAGPESSSEPSCSTSPTRLRAIDGPRRAAYRRVISYTASVAESTDARRPACSSGRAGVASPALFPSKAKARLRQARSVDRTLAHQRPHQGPHRPNALAHFRLLVLRQHQRMALRAYGKREVHT